MTMNFSAVPVNKQHQDDNSLFCNQSSEQLLLLPRTNVHNREYSASNPVDDANISNNYSDIQNIVNNKQLLVAANKTVPQHPTIKQSLLATVNINMGDDCEKPKLIITNNTDIVALVHQFINNYNLPQGAYHIIIAAIKQQLQAVGINVQQLGLNMHMQNKNISSVQKINNQIYDQPNSDKVQNNHNKLQQNSVAENALKFSFAQVQNSKVNINKFDNDCNKSTKTLFKSNKLNKNPANQKKPIQNQQQNKQNCNNDDASKLNFKGINQHHYRFSGQSVDTKILADVDNNSNNNEHKDKHKHRRVVTKISPIRLPVFRNKSPNTIIQKYKKVAQPKTYRSKTPTKNRKQYCKQIAKIDNKQNSTNIVTNRITLQTTPIRKSSAFPQNKQDKRQINKPSSAHLQSLMQQLYLKLTSHQPRNITTLCPQYINFDNIHPRVLVVLQQFFEALHETEFVGMQQQYFVNRTMDTGVALKIYDKFLQQPASQGTTLITQKSKGVMKCKQKTTKYN